jgi:formylglycine-generating enzyme required for sulfatase activity
VPSCEGRAPTCGASGASDCCASLPVPGGSFYRGYDVAADGMHATMAYPATISSFHLDAYEVTVARFRQFVAAGMGTQATAPANDAGAHPNLTASGWQSAWNIGLQPDSTSLVAAVDDDCMQGSGAAMVKTWTDAPASNEDRPIVCVDWYEAFAFCIWDGGYLPTVAESMYAASGGTDQRAYPWSQPFGSTAIDPSDASYSDGTDCVGDGLPGCSVTDLVDVGTKPAGDGAWDQSDLAGNASEMVLDWWMGADAFPDPCTDCAQLTDPGAGARITYGGAYDSNVDQQRSAWADFNVGPSARWHNVGFRCARQ